MLQVGKPQEVYQKIAELLQYHKVDFLVAVGGQIQLTLPFFQGESRHFPDTQSLIAGISGLNFENDLILITGAREFRFEQVVDRLQQRIHGTTLEINLNALTHNYNFYKSKIFPQTKIMVMVKAFAYGGGAAEIANHLQQMGADYLAVAYTDEGVALREAGIKLPIMVLNPVQESFIHLQQFQLEPVVYSPDFFKQLGKYCRHQGTEMPIHLDFDTGMHRLGFEMEHLQNLKTLIIDFPELRIASMYTHLVGADEEAHHEFSIRQLEDFLKMCNTLESQLGYRPLRHALNSAGILRYPEYQMDMVRLGIGLYGVEVSGLYEGALKPISILKTTVSQVKQIQAGETIGYSRKGKMDQDGQIATIAIGYADGYDRRFSNGRGFVLIHGHRAPVIGNVCMDMTMLDVTGLEVREGDEVLIYGPGISLKELAERIGTIPYELLTNISSRVKRVYYLD
jgi:alanine racemase